VSTRQLVLAAKAALRERRIRGQPGEPRRKDGARRDWVGAEQRDEVALVNGTSATWSLRAARGWTRLYTAGARVVARDARRAQIESDLWEHEADADAMAMTSHGLAVEVGGRVVRGIPADLARRFGTGGIEMRSMFIVERGTGLVMLLVSFLLFGAMVGPGISGSEPYFSDDFPAFADDLRSVFRVTLFRFAVGVVMILTAVLLYLTFRPHSKAVAGSARPRWS
jgi:hypothetical protein